MHGTQLGIQLIVGLGNPGPQYEATRHNAGFWWVDQLADEHGSRLNAEGKFQGIAGRLKHTDHEAWLLKPTTFMNASGRAVAAIANFYKIPPQAILVVHDELDLVYGDNRLKVGGGTAGHNGLKSMVQHCGGDGFGRLRIGIGRPRHDTGGDAVVSHVLGDFSTLERSTLPDVLDHAALGVATVLDKAWTLIDPADLVGDLWSVPAYLRMCAPWLSPDEVRMLQRDDPQAWTVSDLPLLDAARQRLGDPEASLRKRQRDATLAAEREEMNQVVDHLIASDDHPHGQRGAAGAADRVEREQLERRHVHDDERPVVECGQPADPLERQLELAQPPGERNVDRGQRRRPDHTVGVESVTLLEARHGSGKAQVVCGAVGHGGCTHLAGGQIADGGEPTPQGFRALEPVAGADHR